jgi:hypothetical protein
MNDLGSYKAASMLAEQAFQEWAKERAKDY